MVGRSVGRLTFDAVSVIPLSIILQREISTALQTCRFSIRYFLFYSSRSNRNIQDYIEAKASSRNQKAYQNVVHEPLLVGDPESLILKAIALPELHILIGISIYYLLCQYL